MKVTTFKRGLFLAFNIRSRNINSSAKAYLQSYGTQIPERENTVAKKWLAFYLVLFIAQLFFISQTRAQSDVLRTGDSLSLVSVYSNAGGSGWINKSGWLTNTPITNWFGVTTTQIGSSLRVTGLSLPNNNLTGTLATSALYELQVLDVRNNPLLQGTGYIANAKLKWIDASNTKIGLPNDIGTLSQLESLNLQNNQIVQPGQSGGAAIPSSITSLTKLTYLNLDNNKFTGSIPSAIGNLTNLTVLSLSQNLLTGDIPTGIGSLTKLTWLGLGNNQLTGAIPTQIGNLVLLQSLILGGNQLSGTIPSQVGNLTALNGYLWLGGNQLTGSIPTQIGNLINLKDLRLDQNQLTGIIPTQLSSLTALTHLYLNSNQLTGIIPLFIGDVVTLQFLDIGANQLTGVVPIELNNLVNLKHFSFCTNQLTGTLPTNFLTNSTLLETLFICNNNFTGSVPLSCLSSPNLTYAALFNGGYDGLPNISTRAIFSNLNGKVEAQNNNFTFEDIEPNRNIAASKFIYTPQLEITATPVSILGQQPLSLSFTVGGSANAYQWQKNGVNIPDANSSMYSKTAALSDGGNYTLVVTNTLVSSLSIKRHVAVSVGAQSITFPAIPAKTFNTVPFILSATSSSSLPVTYVSSNTAVASVNGNVVTLEGAGTCTITAKQAGDASYNPAPDVAQTLTVSKANQTITANLAGLPRLVKQTIYPQSFSTSGLPVVYTPSNSNAEIVFDEYIVARSAGGVNITLSQAGDNNFNAAPNVVVALNILAGQSPYTFIRNDGDAVAQYTGGVSGIEVDASGNVYLPLPNINRIIVLNPNGTVKNILGSTGDPNDELNIPSDIAVDATGNMYVADRNNHRIAVFAPNGTFLRKIGGRGSASGKLLSPGGVAVATDKVYVMEIGNDRVSVFNTGGVFQYAFGTSGAANGQFSFARGIDVDNAGNIYVSDQLNARVQVFSNSGTFIRAFGTAGAGNGQFDRNKHIKVDGTGKIYVADDVNGRIQIFDNNGAFLSNIAWSSGVSGLAMDGSGNIYGCNYNTREVIKYAPSGSVLQTFTPIATAGKQIFNPQGIAIDAANVYVSTLTHEIKVYDFLANYVRKVGSFGSADGQLSSPAGIVVDNAGNLYVADLGNARVQVFDNTGAFVRKIGVGTLVQPFRIALNAGKVYVSDKGNHQVFVYQTDGTFLSSFGGSGTGNGQFNQPNGIAFDGGGNVLVTDYGNKRVQVFTPTNVFLGAFGAAGTAEGQFNGPTDIKMDATGKIYVLDWVNHNIQVFNQAGFYQFTVGSGPVGPGFGGGGNFRNPNGLAVNTDGSLLLVADGGNNLVQSFGFSEINITNNSNSIANNTTFDFANVNMLANKEETFVIQSLGNAPLFTTGYPKILLSGANASSFTITDLVVNRRQEPGTNIEFKIKFAPSASGISTAKIEIANTDPDESNYTINLTGTAAKLNQTITFNSLAPKSFGDAEFGLSATTSSMLPISYSSSNTAVTTIAGSTITIIGVGTTTIKASQFGDTNYNAATDVTQTLTVSKSNQTITFAAPTPKVATDPSFDLTATSSSALPVTYTSSNAAVATISGKTVTIVGAGTTTITASQAGNANYNAAVDVTQSLTVMKATQSITFSVLPTKIIGDAAFPLSATSTSGLTVQFTSASDKVSIIGSQLTLVKAGSVTVTATQPGDTKYAAATSVDQSFCIKPAKPTITASGANTEAITLTSSSTTGNQWFKDGTAITGATNATVSVTTVGVYKLQIKVDDCLSEFSADTPFIITGDISAQSNSITIYPNPVEDYLEVLGLTGEISNSQLADMTGKINTLRLEQKSSVHSANVQHLAAGVYLLRVQQGNSIYQIKFIKK